MTTRSPLRLLIASAGVAALLALAGCSSAAGPANTAEIPTGVAFEGYAVAGDSALKALASDSAALDTVAISGVSLTSEGGGVAASSSDALALLAKAHSATKKAELVVDNIDASKGVYSQAIATKMLSSESNRQFVIAGLAGEVEHGGYDGVQLDFESLSASNSDDLVSFASELRETLPAKATISMALTAQTSASGYLAAGYDLAKLTASIDRFALLAYGEHGSSFSEAGPVGGLPWAQQALAALLTLVPAKTVDLAVAGYGSTWPTTGKGGVISPAEARDQAGSRANWVSAQGEWTAKLADGTVLWWSDARSLTVRANAAKSAGLHGVALWQIATADPVGRG
ncbi:glycosyl hydrolase family 18 protein [Frondihabitans sp. Leaf304]|uniref:glycosyl hydrolase family 18 protein n=1 Tax=Frondihabitans sp. Leaf304 TaxID=1736329 RepID=UPI0006FA3B68|nr:glycosyl hydrolase family 18 protein [Frondihabitans sp. Leaf304]KQQ25636.1 hypothetical protein ASF54_14655 [Frondihabitans sp. Leaf304]